MITFICPQKRVTLPTPHDGHLELVPAISQSYSLTLFKADTSTRSGEYTGEHKGEGVFKGVLLLHMRFQNVNENVTVVFYTF